MNHVLLTFDIDWAPDCVIDHVAEMLLARRVRSTWFVTHASPAIERLRAHPEHFELGIHPNFLPNSDHGSTTAEVIASCMELVPEAVSMRTHGLIQSTALLAQVMSSTPIRNDASLLLPHTPLLRPVNFWWNKRCLLRIPYYWEDDVEMEMPTPCWSASAMLAHEGLKVFDIHPIHAYLNCVTIDAYREVKKLAARLSDVPDRLLKPFVRAGEGPATLLGDLIDYCTTTENGLRINDLVGGKAA